MMPRQTEDAVVLDFARRWEPYGGADASEILLCFGLSVDEFRARLHRILTRTTAYDLDPGVYRRLLRYAATR
ncbi:DUF3263 domain-containing protein [Rhodococcus fascians]|uniref:DUF3263 domain-containing protein n=1 Tax=Nocardiaceae TaxID=85025 RepID=UPI00050BEE22|nr:MULTISPECIES: DUF3263 domain-containing protein [Rhodococcus]RZL75026.1 MAG: DUF3263 domain-containing protein [Rhodococcus sp. (in: high G+C Gram-positive bacteria)]KQU31460.1 hypothetical protein ASH04_13400 [Rhodococcus sp. Leaf233]MBY4010528.1 DUF3263 domain-containing protein [Rhodococcus fascians]MBY4022941.1 DUF3263 domain-containing protein [Rhodococcus fascians]MBY4036926.1 DUF3263 domain-containing protein [Rhodococcus fascians]